MRGWIIGMFFMSLLIVFASFSLAEENQSPLSLTISLDKKEY